MKKNLFFSMFAAVTLLFATSCQQDEVFVDGNETVVTFEVGTPEIATRAFSLGEKATKLQWAVYDESNTPVVRKENANAQEQHLQGTATLEGGKASVNISLAAGKTYKVLFWADAYGNAEGGAYKVDFDNLKMNVNYTGAVCNDESRDAFYNLVEVTVGQANETKEVTLRRPFAQLNIGTDDLDKLDGVSAAKTQVKVNVYNQLDLKTGFVTTGSTATAQTFTLADRPAETEAFPVNGYKYLAMNYLLVGKDKTVVDVEFSYGADAATAKTRTYTGIPVQPNYRTNIYGSLLTQGIDFDVEIEPGYNDDNKHGMVDGKTYMRVDNIDEFNAAFADGDIDMIILGDNIDLNSTLTRASVDPVLTVSAGKDLIIDLNEKTLSSTSSATGKNYNMFDVRGTLTVKNGTIEYKHTGDNMAWNNSTNIFNVTAGGVLNLDGVTAKNLGGSDMAFVAHLNNWGEVTLNVNNSILESTYVPVRVFNSGNDMNNVTIKNSTLKGGKFAFWVHNYTLADFGNDQAKVDAHKALLNLNIFNQGNTFSPDLNGIRFGFTNSVTSDSYGITKSVSEDGTEVTLGSVVEDGIIRRGVAGTEENETIKNVVVEEGVAVLYDRTFRRYYALETVELPNTLTTIGQTGSGVFQSCSVLKNIVIPESVTILGEGSFYGCTSLSTINIPEAITRIEANCLRETGLKEIEFHADVTYFGAQAFRDCKQLTKVIINAPTFTVEPNAFGVMAGALPGTTIYVANAEMKAYLESTLTYASQFTIVAQ